MGAQSSADGSANAGLDDLACVLSCGESSGRSGRAADPGSRECRRDLAGLGNPLESLAASAGDAAADD